MLPFRSKYVSRLAPLAVLGALALVPAAAEATVTSTTVTSPTSKTNVLQLNYGGPLALADAVTATGTAPGASDGDLVQLVCDRDGGSTALPFPLVVNNEKWTTASILPFGLPLGLGALNNAPGSGGRGSMCNVRAIPFGTNPINRLPFAPNAVGIGRIDTFDNGGLSGSPLKNFEAVSNQVAGMYDITSAGDDGVNGSRKFYGSNFAERDQGVFREVANFGQQDLPIPGLNSLGLTNSGDSSIGISNVDGSNPVAGLLPFDQSGSPLGLFNQSDVSVQRTVDAAGNATVKETSRTRDCHIALFVCVDYDDSGLKLDRTTTTSADGVTATITDTWTNTSGSSHRYDMRYYNRVGDAGNTGIGVNGGVPMQKSAGDTFLPGTSGPWSMVINSDTNDPDTDDSDDHGAITYMNAPDVVLMEDSDEFESWYQRTLAPGGSYQVKQVLNQAGTVAEAQSLASSTAAAPAATGPAPSAPATLSASSARQQQAITSAVSKQSAGQGRARYTSSARIARSKSTGKRYIRLQVSGPPGSVRIKISLLDKNGKKVGKAAKITVPTNKKQNIRSLNVPASARKVLLSAL